MALFKHCFSLVESVPGTFSHVYDRLILEDEEIVFEYEGSTSVLAFTSSKIIVVELKGFTGKKRSTTFIPYTKLVGVKYESNEDFSKDVEIELFTNEQAFNFEFKDGQRGLGELVRYLAEKIV